MGSRRDRAGLPLVTTEYYAARARDHLARQFLRNFFQFPPKNTRQSNEFHFVDVLFFVPCSVPSFQGDNLASPRDQRLRKIVADASKTVSERREALLGMSAPAHKWLRKLIATAAAPPHLRSTAERLLADAEAARNAKREAARQARKEGNSAPQAQPEPEPVSTTAPRVDPLGPASVEDLVEQSGKPTLAEIEYQLVHKYCSAHRWSPRAHEVFAAWRTAYFTETEQGKKDLQRIADYMRRCDFEQWEHEANVWRDSGWRDGRGLIEVLSHISTDPAHVHDEETRTGARVFLAEIKRRCA